MITVYVAGPIHDDRGCWYIERNVRYAEAVTVELLNEGFAVFCPHTNNRLMQGAAPREVFLEHDKEILRRCDAMYVLPDSENSKGTQAEIALAEKCAIQVFFTIGDLIIWRAHIVGDPPSREVALDIENAELRDKVAAMELTDNTRTHHIAMLDGVLGALLCWTRCQGDNSNKDPATCQCSSCKVARRARDVLRAVRGKQK
jgi:hypothetical protein